MERHRSEILIRILPKERTLNSSTFNLKFPAVSTARLTENINQQKTVLLRQRQVLSRNYEKLGEFSPKSSMSSVIKQSWSQPFHTFAPAIRANILTSVQDFFVFKQPIKKVRINSTILWPEPLDSRAKASRAKR